MMNECLRNVFRSDFGSEKVAGHVIFFGDLTRLSS